MKKLLLILFVFPLVFVNEPSYAQYNFSLSDLQKLCNKNASDFETFVLGKDYSLQSKLSTPVMKVYTSDKKTADGRQYTISRYQVPNAMAKITFTTTDKKFYLEFKSQLAAEKVKFVKEENRNIDGVQAECNDFASGGLKVSVCSYTTDVTWFKVEIHF